MKWINLYSETCLRVLAMCQRETAESIAIPEIQIKLPHASVRFSEPDDHELFVQKLRSAGYIFLLTDEPMYDHEGM